MWWYVHTMKERAISTARQLGTAVHDARTRAGMTQAALAARAGVSRKWLIGLEQGARTRAELGKVFDVLRALELSIQLFEGREGPEVSSPEADVKAQENTMTPKFAGTSADIGLSTRQALKAVEAMRQAVPASALEAIRQAALPASTLEAIRQATIPASTLEAIRQATIPASTLEAIRQAQDETE
jgi:transcriptional regulator with XRE-family HTH domain